MRNIFRRMMLGILMIMLSSVGLTHARQYFNRNTDLLLANYDLRPDEDDIHSAAALGSMLRHPDMDGVEIYAVAGAYGLQDSDFIGVSVPDFFNDLFGPQNTYWSDAHNDRSGSITRVKAKVRSTLEGGGKVFIAEGGQSHFTKQMLESLISDGFSAATIKANVILVQHSYRNEANDMTDPDVLTWVKNNTDYEHIADGNRSDAAGAGTPGYATTGANYLTSAKSSSNTNTFTRTLWTQVHAMTDSFTADYENPKIAAGGLDFSDHVEVWWILGEDTATDTVSKFWNRYVYQDGGPTVDPGTQQPYTGINAPIPGTVEAENYDRGDEGVAYHDTSSGNEGGAYRTDPVDIGERDGGYVVGWTQSGEWTEYTVDVLPGEYDITARYATTESGQTLNVTLDGEQVGTYTMTPTASWTSYSEMTLNDIMLSGGTGKVLRITWGGNVALNWLRFEGGPPPSTNDILAVTADDTVEAARFGTVSFSYEAVDNATFRIDVVEKGSGTTVATQSIVRDAGRDSISTTLEIPGTTAAGEYEWQVSMLVSGVVVDSEILDLTITEKFIPPPAPEGIKIGENYIVIDTSYTDSALGSWVVRRDGEAYYRVGSTELGPIDGDYLEFTGNTINGGAPKDPLRYTFVAPKTATYRLSARMLQRLEGAANDKCNDVYVKMIGNFTSGGSFDTALMKTDLKFYGRALDQWGNMYNGEDPHEWKQPMIYNLIAGEEYTLVVSGRAQRTCVDYFILYESNINFKGLGEPSKGGADIAVVNDAKYLPGSQLEEEMSQEVKAVDFDQYTGLAGYVDAEIDNRGGKSCLTSPERLQTSAAIYTYNGPSGKVCFKLNAMLETDGECTYEVYINGVRVGKAFNPRIYGTSTPNYTIKNHQLNYWAVQLNDGDQIKVTFQNDTNELVAETGGWATARARWHSLEIWPVADDAPPITETTLADTYVRGGVNAENNYGLEIELAVKQDLTYPDYNRETLIQVVFPDAMANVDVRSALLRLNVNSNDGAGTNYLYLADSDNWTASSVTYSSKPNAVALIDHAYPPVSGEWMEFDIADVLQAELAGDRKLSMVLKSADAALVSYHSMDAINENLRPQLVVDINNRPQFSGSTIDGGTAIQDEAYTGQLSASDLDGEELSYAKVSGPDWLSVATDGVLSGIPRAGSAGPNSFVVQVTDASGGSATTTLNIQVGGSSYAVEFVTSEGYSDGVLSSHADWSCNKSGTVAGDTTGSGYAALDTAGWERSVFQQGLPKDMKSYSTSLVFTFDESASVANMPLLYAGIFAQSDAAGTERTRATFNRIGGVGYNIRFEVAWADPNGFDTVTVSRDALGVNPAENDTTDLLKLTSTMIRGVDENDWTVNIKLFNLTADPVQANALIDHTATGIIHTNLFNASNIYGGWGGAQSDGFALVSNRRIQRFEYSGKSSLAVPSMTYGEWAQVHGIVGGPEGDDDHDGILNLMEYAVGETMPYMRMNSDGSVDYMHQKRQGDTNLNYAVEWSTNLNAGVWHTNFMEEAHAATDSLDFMENRKQVDGSGKAALFFRLKVDHP